MQISVKADLVAAARKLRGLIGEKREGEQVHMDAREAARLRDLLHRAVQAFESCEATEATLSRRVGQLESSNGNLMLDRDRWQQRAAEADGTARQLLIDALGIDAPEVDRRMREQAEYDARSWSHMDAERVAYDQFRTTVVQIMHEAGDGPISPERWGEVRKAVARANKRALGR
jgi:hypothetical protein